MQKCGGDCKVRQLAPSGIPHKLYYYTGMTLLRSDEVREQ